VNQWIQAYRQPIGKCQSKGVMPGIGVSYCPPSLDPNLYADSVARTRIEISRQMAPIPFTSLFGIGSRRGVESIVPRRTFEDVVLPPATRRTLDTALAQVTQHELIFNRWGLGERHPTGLALAFNFAGPPGTGKTICAEAIAHFLDRRLMLVRYAELESMWMGETPKNVAAIFRMAREERAVLFFDEADAIASRRSTSVDHGFQRESNGRQRPVAGARVVQRRGDLRHEPRGEFRSRF
jgi:SpoVK/Ycf46/Vps4 family AAA+-type ATPase